MQFLATRRHRIRHRRQEVHGQEEATQGEDGGLVGWRRRVELKGVLGGGSLCALVPRELVVRFPAGHDVRLVIVFLAGLHRVVGLLIEESVLVLGALII